MKNTNQRFIDDIDKALQMDSIESTQNRLLEMLLKPNYQISDTGKRIIERLIYRISEIQYNKIRVKEQNSE